MAFRPLNVVVAPGSKAEKRFREKAAGMQSPGFLKEVLAPGIHPTPEHNLIFHGGKTIAHLSFANFYIGSEDAWDDHDIKNIDEALGAAMSDNQLNNVIQQYFKEEISSKFTGSKILPDLRKPRVFSQGDVESLLAGLFKEKSLDDFSKDLDSTVFNFFLPKGSILNTDKRRTRVRKNALLVDEEESSLEGLGGYHGSIHQSNQTLYYAIGVYSDWLPDERANGIPFFDEPWKNVVATFYHELNEARTDADVEDAIKASEAGDEKKAMQYIGWISRQGEECGDFPVFEAGSDLGLVMKEVRLSDGTSVPVQFQYSNAVAGPEGPISKPHKL
jgi:hypothetical protein